MSLNGHSVAVTPNCAVSEVVPWAPVAVGISSIRILVRTKHIDNVANIDLRMGPLLRVVNSFSPLWVEFSLSLP